jgi:hypothetical protein
MPEREAMNHLGHESRAIHAAYAGGPTVATLSLEFYEAQNLKSVVQFFDGARGELERKSIKDGFLTG